MSKRYYKNPQVNLRIPQKLKELVEDAANKSGRSMNAELVTRIEKSFDKPSNDKSELADLMRSIIQEELDKQFRNVFFDSSEKPLKK